MKKITILIISLICSVFMNAQTIGENCNSPIEINNLPFTTSDDTANFGNNYSGNEELWLTGNDVIYHYQAPSDGAIFIKLSNINNAGAGIFVYENCSEIDATSPLKEETNVFGTDNLSIPITEVSLGSDYYIVVSSVNVAPVSTQSISYTLEIENTDPCYSIENIQVSNILIDGAEISWDNDTALNYEWYVFSSGAIVDPSDPYADSPILQGNTISNSIVVSGLIPDTSYDVYVESECSNPAGNINSEWSDPVTFETLECFLPTNIQITNETYNSVEINWTENGTANEWEVLYVETGYSPFISGTYIVVDNNPGLIIDNLIAGKGYDIYLRSICGGHEGDWTELVTFYTLECSPPTDIVVSSNETENSVELSWVENGIATEWEIKYGSTGFDPSTQGESKMDTDGVLGEILTGLTNNVEYEVYVRSVCTTNLVSEWSSPKSFQTNLATSNLNRMNGLCYYPNPVKDILTINAPQTIKEISIYNIQGKLLIKKKLNDTLGNIDLSSFSSGIYLMQVMGHSRTFSTHKIVKE
ncbi:fibronectin type III domain-containing protein [Mesonia aquimarina]|uniref:fibronectin type III domain-containing protein n=1 Tax=Mesonia aquimarina TaxID=1504967 RepID=UPI000EF5A95B|nr:fibronectin type III domain-containing protein [Mesonia aquimarina]